MKSLMVLIFLLLLATNCYALSWSNNLAFPSSGVQYVPDAYYGFQIDWDAEGLSVSDVIFEFGIPPLNLSANNTAVFNISNTYYVNFTDMPPATYVYRWFAVDNESNWASTDQSQYTINKNSSTVIHLYLNGTEGNRSYKKNSVANLTAFLETGKTVYLDSSYPGFVENSGTSSSESSVNLTSEGLFSVTAYWNGDPYYMSSSITYYFDNLAPRFSDETTYPLYSSMYSPNQTYSFRIIWFDADLTEVKFESNFSGSKKNYTTTTNPKIHNDGDRYWINLTNLRARDLYYKWFAKDGSNMGSNTTKKTYRIYKAYALTFYVPFEEVKNGTTVVVTCYSNTGQVDIDDFDLYRNGTKIGNTSSLSRTDISTLDVGAYEYICETDGTQNYSAQSINKTIVVLLDYEEPVIKKEFKISQVSSPQIDAGDSGQGTFNLSSTLDETIINLDISLTGIDSSWYTIENIPAALLTGGSVIIRINFDIPQDAEEKEYNISIRASGKAENLTKIATAQMILNVGEFVPVQNQPPSYSSFIADNDVAGEQALFSMQVYDDNGLSGFIFSTNNTGAWVNDSWVPLTGTEDYIEVTKDLNPATGLVIAWKAYINDTDNDWTVSDENYLTTGEEAGEDYTVPIIIVIVFGAIAVLFLFIKKSKPKLKNIQYVYTKEDAR